MRDSFVETASAIVRFTHHKHHSPLVLHTALALVPVLAEYDTQTFVEHYLAPSMDQLVAHLAVPADRDVAFAAIGRLAHAVGSEVRPFLDRIMKHVRAALQAAAHETVAHTAAVFGCVGMLVRSAVAPLVMGAVHELLDDMFACGLSAELFAVLTHISSSLPALLRPIQVRMLDALARTLTGRPFVPCGAPTYDAPAKVNGATHSPKRRPERDTSAAALKLALEILGSFDFSEHTLTEFVRDACLPYMAHSAGDVRLAAARTCAALLLRDATVYHMSQHATGIVHEVIVVHTVGAIDFTLIAPRISDRALLKWFLLKVNFTVSFPISCLTKTDSVFAR
ncbi:hypothetical protein AURDEDRAFT_74412 [Auricularia subglabra TFB-10046 SS5]|nr:hypothetical protein AURDEDRAFT_74412 [Auricularia subglabra TFB-10046 SS5]